MGRHRSCIQRGSCHRPGYLWPLTTGRHRTQSSARCSLLPRRMLPPPHPCLMVWAAAGSRHFPASLWSPWQPTCLGQALWDENCPLMSVKVHRSVALMSGSTSQGSVTELHCLNSMSFLCLFPYRSSSCHCYFLTYHDCDLSHWTLGVALD